MPRDFNGQYRLLMKAERLAVSAARNACSRCGYVRAAQVLARVIARDNAENGPRILAPALRQFHRDEHREVTSHGDN